jgi:hypothetical protein
MAPIPAHVPTTSTRRITSSESELCRVGPKGPGCRRGVGNRGGHFRAHRWGKRMQDLCRHRWHVKAMQVLLVCEGHAGFASMQGLCR